jgi:hypothetical protein
MLFRVFIILFFLSKLHAFSEAYSSSCQKHQRFVVKLHLYSQNLLEGLEGVSQKDYLATFSGFFINEDGLFLTSAHALEKCLKGFIIADWIDEEGDLHSLDILNYAEGLEEEKYIKKIYYKGIAALIVEAAESINFDSSKDEVEILYFCPEFDVAVLKLNEIKKIKEIFIKPQSFTKRNKVLNGQAMLVCAFKDQEELFYDNTTSELSITKFSTQIAGLDRYFEPKYGLYVLDRHPINYAVGAPVLDEEGCIIGMISNASIISNHFLVVPVETIAHVLRDSSKYFLSK